MLSRVLTRIMTENPAHSWCFTSEFLFPVGMGRDMELLPIRSQTQDRRLAEAPSNILK